MDNALGAAPSEMWVDRRGAKRVVEMQVLVLGYPRTGTSSIRDALQILGYSEVHHMLSAFVNPPEAEMWLEALEAKERGEIWGREQWDSLLGHCQAVTDAPSVCFSEALIATYPDAKVVLTNRDPDRWWGSFSTTILPGMQSRWYGLTAYLDPQVSGRLVPMTRRVVSALLGDLATLTEDRAKTAFNDHYERIRALVPKERLLEYEVSQGWEPLCEFLGRGVPKEAFPRVNDAAQFQERLDQSIRSIVATFVVRKVVPAVVLTAAAAAAWYWTQGRF
ncbi:hypothetical protein HMN09_00855500 [Mycena chlorophos]|uniref:NAD dependent epimerase/dehydratase n=1 Tax=Mycena chlorophos TaxID=658473 RepID=A0A8H6W3Q2_MYCCL|nr:hypothetical protein HMN09_00855500 [Mycena chlorophos]